MATASLATEPGPDRVIPGQLLGGMPRDSSTLWRHVFRNALLPLVTIAGLALPGLIGGSFVIETIFSWPGIGLLGYTAILQRDYPLQMGIALLSAVAVLLANLLTDMAYALVDPRIRYD